MALTSAQQVRLKIQDIPVWTDVTTYGDGSANTFQLQHRNIVSGVAYVPGAGGWSGTGASFSAAGFVTLGTAISAQSAIRFRYVYSTFSDTDVDHFISAGGSVNGAAIEAVQALMFDGLRRAAWRASDGAEYDDTKAISLLKDIYATLKTEEEEEAALSGGFASWAVNQGDY